MGSTPPEPMMMNSNSSPHKLNAKQQLWPGSPSAAKKLRLGDEERPMAQINEEIPLATVLQGFSQQQLIDMIVGKVAGDAKAEAELRAKLPMPDIE